MRNSQKHNSQPVLESLNLKSDGKSFAVTIWNVVSWKRNRSKQTAASTTNCRKFIMVLGRLFTIVQPYVMLAMVGHKRNSEQ